MFPKLNTANQCGQSPAFPGVLPALVLYFGALLTGQAADIPSAGRPPRLSAINPPGATLGGVQTWTLGGRNLDRVDRVAIDGDGVSAVIKAQNDRSILAEVRADPRASPGFRLVRVEGPDGISNPRVVRLDRLTQTAEQEANDTPDRATPLPAGSAGVGELTPRDLDHFRVTGKKGRRVTIELEARRLGLPVAPVVTLMTPDGRALAQGRETPGVDGDCRFLFTYPADGAYVVQVRDNRFGGSSGGLYRLRVTDEPFATGLFPLGGPPGRSITVSASGGNLATPLSRTVHLPDRPGSLIEVPPFQNGQDSVLAPGRLVVGDGPEVFETADRVTSLEAGVTVNGRIERPGEVDRYRFGVNTGQVVVFKVVAAPLGSWLDSVVTVRDSRGKRLAENDDKPGPARRPGIEPNPDSLLIFHAGSDADLTVEVADRFGRGGPEYSYRLVAGTDRPDFTVHVRILEAMGVELDLDDVNELEILGEGACWMKPGESLKIGCQVIPENQTGPITLRAEGLPEGVNASPVTVHPQPTGPKNGAARITARGILTLRAEHGSAGASGRFRVVATATPANGPPLERLATQAVSINFGEAGDRRTLILRRIAEFPVRVTAP